MRPAALGNHATLRCAIKEADAEQEGFEHIFKGVRRFTEKRRHRGNPNRPTVKLIQHHLQ
jgi:hypothetical protein